MDSTQTKKKPLSGPLSKRARTEVRMSNTSTSSLGTKSKTIFLIAHSQSDTHLGKLSPFFIEKAIRGISSEVNQIKKLRSGDLLLEVPSNKADVFLHCTNLADKSVSFSLHKTLNTSRGVISENDLLELSEEELLQGFAATGVTNVRRITIRRDNKQIPTRNIILTFDTPDLPETITAGYLRCKIRPYVPNPLRCFNCQRYGHGAKTCRGKATCPKCGKDTHGEENCTSGPHCTNCGGDHPAYSRSCPSWKIEKEIQSVRVIQGISYAEARKQVTPFHLPKTFAAAAKTVKTNTIGVQTEISCPPAESFAEWLRKIHCLSQSSKQSVSTATVLSVAANASPSGNKKSTKQKERNKSNEPVKERDISLDRKETSDDSSEEMEVVRETPPGGKIHVKYKGRVPILPPS